MVRHSVTGLLCALGLLAAAAAASQPAPGYKLSKTVLLGAPDRWDYVVADADTARVFIAHGDRLAVFDTAGQAIGEVTGMPGGTHGVAVSHATGQGFTDDGEKGEAVAFDLKTLKVRRHIPVADDADGIARDPATGRIFIVEGDPGTISLIDPATDTVVATIKAGEKMEYPAADDAGHVFVAGEEKSDLVEVDARTGKLVARWAAPDCAKPHGLAVDAANHRAFMGCVNARMMVIDTRTGKVVGELPIGLGNDAVAFDPVRHRVFSSNGKDGTVSVYQQLTPDGYRALPTIATVVSARTMAVDPRTGRLFVVGADVDPAPAAGGRPHVRPGTARLMIFDPAG